MSPGNTGKLLNEPQRLKMAANSGSDSGSCYIDHSISLRFITSLNSSCAKQYFIPKLFCFVPAFEQFS